MAVGGQKRKNKTLGLSVSFFLMDMMPLKEAGQKG
jgi:hypothetical protein